MANTTFKDSVLRAVAILGLIAILLLGAWGIIQLAFFISDLVSNAGGQASSSQQTSGHEFITASIPAEATTGQSVTITWNHTGSSGNYSYQLSYSCVAGMTFKAPVPTGSTQTVSCDTPFNYTQASTSLALTPLYSGTTDAKVTITIMATNLATGAVTAQTSGSMTVHPGKTASKPATTTKKPTTSSSSSKAKSTYVASSRSYQSLYGYSDLAVTITSAYSQNGNAALQFVVQNVGTNVTPSHWTFVANLPSGYQYQSAPQQALYPGDKIVYSMGYSDYTSSGYTYGNTQQYPYGTYGSYNPYGCSTMGAYGYGCANGSSNYGYNGVYGPRTVSVTVDPFNQIMELTKANNTASATYNAY
jgi:hypothetical protein